jgi:hypothetical protein
MNNTLVDIIQFLSLSLTGIISYIVKSIWSDMKKMRNELTVLQTEHRLMCVTHHKLTGVSDGTGEEI